MKRISKSRSRYSKNQNKYLHANNRPDCIALQVDKIGMKMKVKLQSAFSPKCFLVVTIKIIALVLNVSLVKATRRRAGLSN